MENTNQKPLQYVELRVNPAVLIHLRNSEQVSLAGDRLFLSNEEAMNIYAALRRRFHPDAPQGQPVPWVEEDEGED